jgi:2-dehydro-3-deoxygalactonokinase
MNTEMQTHDEGAVICLDMGTTRTRAWVLDATRILARQAIDFGVRDLAHGEKNHLLKCHLLPLIAATVGNARRNGLRTEPVSIIAAGMIGAPQGVQEVPHILASAGVEELRAGIRQIELPDVFSLPLRIVPGVRVAAMSADVAGICETDVVRGEECLCMGLVSLGQLHGNEALLNLGSHWKWILLDNQRRIARSRTSLTGEMIHVVQTNTLLSSGLPQHKPEGIDKAWLQHGMDQTKKEGLSRTLFCVRLLEQSGTSTPGERLSFLYGAFLQEEVRSLAQSDFFNTSILRNTLIAGPPALASVWQDALSHMGRSSSVLPEAEVETAYLHGLKTVAFTGAR